MYPSRKLACSSLRVSAAIASSTTAFSAENTSDPLAEVVVTAQFREQRLQDTPLAITAVNGEMLEARGQTSIAQVAAQAPNVSLRPQPQNGGSGLIAFIRGVGQTDFNYAPRPRRRRVHRRRLHSNAVELAARADRPRSRRNPARPTGHSRRQERDRRRNQAVQRPTQGR